MVARSSLAVAPLEHLDAVERMRLQPIDHVGRERLGIAGDAERAVVHVAAGAAGDLGEFARRQVAMVLAVELARRGERDMLDVEIEPHADRIGGDEIVDVARLVERDLGVARARGQRAEHDGGAADLAPHQLGDGVDLGRREGDDRRPLRQPRDLLLAGIGELREPRPRDEVGARNEIADRIAHRRGAEQQCFGAAARVQQPVGEDVAALGIGGELDLVDREEIDVDVARHRLDRRDPVAGTLRLDLFLARDQRNVAGADAGDDLVVDFAREQPQRQADQPAFVPQHPLDREMGLAGIGRAEHSRHVTDAGLKRHVHSWGIPSRSSRASNSEPSQSVVRQSSDEFMPARIYSGPVLLVFRPLPTGRSIIPRPRRHCDGRAEGAFNRRDTCDGLPHTPAHA